MKKKDIGKDKEPKLEEVGKFVYVPGSISKVGPEPSDEEIREELEDRRAGGRCVRCEEKLDEGAEFCKHCGLKVHIK